MHTSRIGPTHRQRIDEIRTGAIFARQHLADCGGDAVRAYEQVGGGRVEK